MLYELMYHISIHSLRMEGDFIISLIASGSLSYFNPLPPHGGRRFFDAFQLHFFYFNPLPPHGGRLSFWSMATPLWKFQSTPSAWRETGAYPAHHPSGNTFQSTPSAWRETERSRSNLLAKIISIHSLRMEGDICTKFQDVIADHFNPLPPHGGRRVQTIQLLKCQRHFNPLPPHGGRRRAARPDWQVPISIHSLRMEGDFVTFAGCSGGEKFQSTPSAWRET